MESPTFELSRDLEALKLVASEQRRLIGHSQTADDASNEGTLGAGPATGGEGGPEPQFNTFQALSLMAKDRPTHYVAPPSSSCTSETRTNTGVGASQSSCQVSKRPSLLFAHLEHSTREEMADGGAMCCNCDGGQWNRTSACAVNTAGSVSVCRVCGGSRVTAQNSNEDIVTSFNSLSVSHFGSSNSLRPLSHSVAAAAGGTGMSCRQQAVTCGAGGRCYDDTTVDDLAGYLDEIMFLPKPMSEMAELMYT